MCTVTFLPIDGKLFITSNRDENAKRPLALPPSRHDSNRYSFVCPKDQLAGGTWIAYRNDGSVMVLLNGAFQKHIAQPPYRKSRGLIFWDIFVTKRPAGTFTRINLHDIAPFTMVLWQNDRLTEMRWDGVRKNLAQKDARTPHIWSSCTVYTQESILSREKHFQQWLAQPKQYSPAEVMQFHLCTRQNEEELESIRINRNNEMLTVSVSCVEMSHRHSHFYYSDLLTEKNYHLPL